MNIKNPELIKRLATFKPFFQLKPVITAAGQFIPTDWSRGIFMDPAILKLVAKEFVEMIDFSKIDVIAGIELQGVTIAASLALETGKPMVIVREKPKREGCSPVIGDVNFLFPGVRTLLVDDLMAYGGTKEARTLLLEERGATVTDMAVVIQARCVPPTEQLESYDYTATEWLTKRQIILHSLIFHHELGQLQEQADTISLELCAIIQENANGPYWEKADNLERLYELMKKEKVKIEDFVLQFMKEHGVSI